jgi:hypothetical protein
MATLYGRKQAREALLKYVGDISQVARVKPYRLIEGHEDQLLAVDVTTGSGLEFTVLPGRGMDISAARYNGRSLAWRSPTGDQHAAFYEPEGDNWLRSFQGGLLVTCGLTWMGASCEDEGRPLGLHGRSSHLPAANVHWDGQWEGDDYVLSVSGKVREAIVFGENVQMTRTIRAKMGESRLFIEDRVENLGYERTPHMILYHINMGYPVLDESARLLAPSVRVTARDADAEAGTEEWSRMQPPTPRFRAQVFFHEMQPDADGSVTTAFVNESGGIGDLKGVYVRYYPEELPCFTQWKMMDQGAYVVGMEPGNARVMGRDAERREGRLQFLEPGEQRRYRLEIGVVTEQTQVTALEEAARKARQIG